MKPSPLELEPDDDRDIPECWHPETVVYRPVPGWLHYRVGSDRSVWRNTTGDWPPPWNEPCWVRLKPRQSPGETAAVRLRAAGREYSRSVELLYRAAFAPAEVMPAWLARIGPRSLAEVRELRAPIDLSTLPLHPPAMPLATVADVHQAEAAPAAPTPLVIAEDDDNGDGPARGSANGRAVLTEPDVILARRLHAEGASYPELVRRFRVGKVTLFYAITGRTWSHIPMYEPPSS